ncbi:MAG: ABC transporter permease [Methanomassiliicoccales archaeon]|nr:ABC transporter permease [Methanomassiliicoccales archaeon]
MSEESNLHLPSDFVQTGTVARYELLKHLRSKRLLGIFVLEFAIIALIMVIPPLQGHDYPSDPADFAKMFVRWVWILTVVGTTLFAGDSLVSEFQHRTGYLLFPNPVKRRILFVGKFAATLAIMFLALAIYYAVVSILALAIDGSISGLTASSFGLALLFAVSASTIGYLLSSVMKGSTGALVLTFAFLFLILPIVDGVLTFSQVKPDFSLTFSTSAIIDVMDSPYPIDFVETIEMPGGGVFEYASYYPNVGVAIAVGAVYAIVATGISLWLFIRREMAA